LLLNVPAENTLIRALVETLDRVVDDSIECGIRIALEMEPGPLHLMSSPSVVSRVLELTNPDRIGANIDVAHYAFLARESAENVIGRWGLGGRIFHSHISGHSIGHLGDVGLNDLGQASAGLFDPWLNGLRWLKNQSKSFGSAFSGLVSLEIECVRCADQCIQGSADVLNRMLN
jgi:sugar phosphate isomerase/epimerase